MSKPKPLDKGGTMDILREELTALLNRHSAENESDTPDWILAAYLMNCLNNFDSAVKEREKWYGRPEGVIEIDENGVVRTNP